jgi:hypothetical protein
MNPETRKTLLNGGCHCGSVRYRLDWPLPDRLASNQASSVKREILIPGRRCGCTFCTRFQGTWASDPEARLEFASGARNHLTAYRFATASAQFMFCARCGVLLVALSTIDERERAVINIRTLDQTPVEAGTGQSEYVIDESESCFDGEDLEQRTARRSERWIATVVWLP